MNNRFVPSFHFATGAGKLTPAWCYEAVTYLYYNLSNKSLLHGKNLDEIYQYATGNINMDYFKKKMSKDLKKKMEDVTLRGLMSTDLDPAHYEPLPLIFDKLNAAMATNDKIPFEVKCTAIDPLAKKKKEDDLLFLKNKPSLEAELQDISDQIGLGKVYLGTTKNSAIPFSDSPYGLDLNEPDELQVFVDLLYNLSVEAAYETISQHLYILKNLNQYRHLEAKDQYWYGVSVNEAYESTITRMPDIAYVYPGDVYVPYSVLPDYADRTHDFEELNPTVMDLFNMMGDEICDEQTLENIINGEYGYCECQKRDRIETRNFNTFKVSLQKWEVKSVDWVGVKQIEGTDEYTLTYEESECKNKIWAQNTYSFYWLHKTKYFFKVNKLGYAHRKKGQESYQGFSKSIYKSQEKSAVELAIPANRVAQIAYIKKVHAIIMSLPAGKVIDLKGIRSALDGALKEDTNGYTMDRLITWAFEENKMLIDTTDFNGSNDGQLKPFYEIPGGVKSEIIGYDNVIADAENKIAQFTGVNAQLTGQSANPEGLIGLQKLLINASQNSISYVNTAITTQYQKLFNIWAYIIKDGIEKYPEVKKSYENIIGSQKVTIIDALSDLPLHTMGISISFTQREEERALWNQYFMLLIEKGVLNGSDLYMLNYVQNPKDKFAMLAVKEKQFEKRQQEKVEVQNAHQQEMLQQQGQNQVQAVNAEVDGDIKKIYSKGDVESKMLTLGSQLGISQTQMDGLIKRSLQRERGVDQTDKAVKTIQAKANAENSKSLI